MPVSFLLPATIGYCCPEFRSCCGELKPKLGKYVPNFSFIALLAPNGHGLSNLV